MSNANITITTIKPSAADAIFASFKPRKASESAPDTVTAYASYALPVEIAQILHSELKAFASRAYDAEITRILREAIKSGKASFSAPSLSDCFAVSSGKEYLITAKDLGLWLDKAMLVIETAIATKSGKPADSVIVVKKAMQYRKTMEAIASRSIMLQDEIDAALRVLNLLLDSGFDHAYTDNVAGGIARKQEVLNDRLASEEEDSAESVDF